jgi:hypothetical protein
MAEGHEDPWAFMRVDKENKYTAAASPSLVVRKSTVPLHTMLP